MTSTDRELNWKELVESVRGGELEPQTGPLPRFMYCQERNVFVSDPFLIGQIVQARSHKEPFFLIGEMGTGKNIFLHLVAKGDPAGKTAIDCKDENVEGTLAQMMEKFFGPNGLVEKHSSALFHFDKLENANSEEWSVFVDKLHQLARNRTLYRTDGEMSAGLDIRVVGGATVDFTSHPSLTSSMSYLFNFLSTNQLTRTRPLAEQTERMQTILAEILASYVLRSKSKAAEERVRMVERISDSELQALQNHTWPKGFDELVRLVNTAISMGIWKDAIAQNIPCKVFILWSKEHKEEARILNSMLKASEIPTFFSGEAMDIGPWWPQLLSVIDQIDYVILCITEGIFSREGVHLKELRRVMDRANMMPRPFIIPVVLDGSPIEDFVARSPVEAQFLQFLKSQHWFWVCMPEGHGLPDLVMRLKRNCQELRKRQLS